MEQRTSRLKKLLILDFDGTIVRLDIDYDGLRERLRGHFLEFGLSPALKPLLEGMSAALDQIHSSYPGEFEATRKAVRDILEEEECRPAGSLVLGSQTQNVLEDLKRRHLRLAIITLNGRKCVEAALQRFGLSDLFDAVIAREDCAGIKPSPEAVEMLLERFGIVREETLLAGDGWRDREMARNAGVDFVLVRGKSHDAGPEDVGSVNDLSELEYFVGG
jgi:pyrophosphatase PpaX